MVEKKISIYGLNENQSPFNDDKLILEICNTQLTLLKKSVATNKITALEIFLFNSNEHDWHNIFFHVKRHSVLLDKSYNDTRVFYNLNEVIVIPQEKFTVDNAQDFLNTIYGEPINDIVKFDHIIHPQIVVAYRIKQVLNDVINSNLTMITHKHVYSKIVENIFSVDKNSSSTFIKLQVYYHQFLIMLVVDNKLQLIQLYNYQIAEDILYYLVKVAQQFNVDVTDANIEVSGFVQLHGTLFDYLQQTFPKISFDNNYDDLLKESSEEYPLHFFTPYFNLAV